MRIESVIGRNHEVSLTRTIFPSVDKPLVIEAYTFTSILQVSRVDGKLEVQIIRDGKALAPVSVVEGETAPIRF